MSFELALKEIQAHVRVYKAFQEAENALVALASLEQHTKELEASKKVLDLSLTKLKTDIKEKQNKLLDLDVKLNSKELFVKEQMKEYEAQKNFELEYAYGLRKKEKEEVIEGLSSKVLGLETKVTGYDTYLRSKQQELDLLESKITAAKEQMQRMLNGSV